MDQNNAFFAWQVYRYEDGRSQVPCQFETLINFPAVKQGLIWHKKLKMHLFDGPQCQKAVGGIYFTKKLRAEQSMFKIWQFRTLA